MSGRPSDVYSLVADIGGTNTRVALADGPTLLPETIRRYRNSEHPGLNSVLNEFLEAEGGVDCRAACVAIAGPVRNGRGKLTNLDWTVDQQSVADAARAETTDVLNDLQAQGHALGRIAPENLKQVCPGSPADEGASQLVIGVGTGFNVAPVHHLPGARIVAASESGHASLPVRTDEDASLAHFVARKHGFPEVEEVLSGRGIENVFSWLNSGTDGLTPASASEIMALVEAGESPLAAKAVEVFVRILGQVAGDLALVNLPFGGIFLAGGVSRAMAPWFERFRFAEQFRDKGRFSEFMDAFPIWVIEDDFAALAGCAAHLDRINGAGN